MSLLNCTLGDLAIAVQCEVPANLGKIVRIIGSHGLDTWSDFDRPLHLWVIESVGESRLSYEYPGGKIRRQRKGLAPDIFLRPIRDPDAPLGIAIEDELTIPADREVAYV